MTLTRLSRDEIVDGGLALDQFTAGLAGGESPAEVTEGDLTLPDGKRVPVILGQAHFDVGRRLAPPLRFARRRNEDRDPTLAESPESVPRPLLPSLEGDQHSRVERDHAAFFLRFDRLMTRSIHSSMTAVSPQTNPVAWSRKMPRPILAAGLMSVWNTADERLCR